MVYNTYFNMGQTVIDPAGDKRNVVRIEVIHEYRGGMPRALYWLQDMPRSYTEDQLTPIVYRQKSVLSIIGG